jgi:hypothetical protein
MKSFKREQRGDVGVLHLRADLFKLGRVCRRLGGLSKLVGTHRGQNRHEAGCTKSRCYVDGALQDAIGQLRRAI